MEEAKGSNVKLTFIEQLLYTGPDGKFQICYLS